MLAHITSPQREWHASILCCYWLQYQLHWQLKQVRSRRWFHHCESPEYYWSVLMLTVGCVASQRVCLVIALR